MADATLHMPGEGENFEMGASRISLKAVAVLEGVLTFRIGDDTVEGPPGTFVCAPPGVPHTFSNPGSEPARFLNFNVPGGPPDPATIGAIASRHDFEVV